MSDVEGHAAGTRPVIGVLLAVGSVLLWGVGPVLGRQLALDGLDMPKVAWLRVMIALVTLLLWLAATDRGWWREAPALARDKWSVAAMVCYAANMLVFHIALDLTTSSAVIVLENTAPLYAVFGAALLFREPLRLRNVIALALALVGVRLVAGDDGGEAIAAVQRFWGNLFALAAGLTWGGYILACRGQGRRVGGRDPGLTQTLLVLLGSTALLLPFGFSSGGWPETRENWLVVLWLGSVNTGVATVLWRLALRHLPTYAAALLFPLTVVVTMTTAAAFLGEYPSRVMLLGAAAIVSALGLVLVPTRQRAAVPA